MRRLFALSLFTLTALGTGIAVAAPLAVPVTTGKDRIYGGAATPTCEWPSTVYVRLTDALCSGTLIHPQIVVYASHCGTSVDHIGLGETLTGGRTIKPSYCRVYPGHSPENGSDFAYCMLPTPVTDVPIVPPLMGCELNALQPNKTIVLVGFGLDEAGVAGIKRNVTSTQDFTAANKAFIGGDGRDTCNGDSGGPAFLQVTATDGVTGTADNSWRVYGITSYGLSSSCGGGSYDSIISNAVPWIEADSGVDITPCTDADGTWNPGPSCGGFPMQPGTASGAWSNGCSGGQVSGYAATCGAPYKAGPYVKITSPLGDNTVAAGVGLMVDVQVSADAQSNATVSATYDGAMLPMSGGGSGGYTFGPVTNVHDGLHTLVATVVSGGTTNTDQVQLTLATDPNLVTGGCAATGTGTGPMLPLCLLGAAGLLRRHRRGGAWLALIALSVGVSACGPTTYGYSFIANPNDGSGPAMSPNAHLVAPPSVANALDANVANVPFQAASSLYLYSEFTDGCSTNSGVCTVAYIYVTNEANYCNYVLEYSDSAKASYFSIALVDNRPQGDAPISGTYPVFYSADPNAALPVGLFAEVQFQQNGSSCQNQLTDAQSYATSGNVIINTVLSTGGAYITGTLDHVMVGQQNDLVTGTFTALGCTPPEVLSGTTTGPACQ